MWCMTDDADSKISGDLQEVGRALLGARLKLARQRKFRTATEASDALAALGRPRSSRSYQSHESGERLPALEDLTIYAHLFEVPFDYFLTGKHADIDPAKIQAQEEKNRRKAERRLRQQSGGTSQISAKDKRADSVAFRIPINQIPRQFETTSIHNSGIRLIPILSASELRTGVNGRGEASTVSSHKLPVPQSLNAGEHSYSFRIPEHDLSMLSKEGISFAPGTYLVADADAPILPGRYVIAIIEGFEEPLFRTFKSARPYSPGTPFTLEALNGAYEPIHIAGADTARVIRIERVIYASTAI